MAGTTATRGYGNIADRRCTARALQAWQAAYWTRDELPAHSDLAALDATYEKSTFFIALDRENGVIDRIIQGNNAETGPHPDLGEHVPEPILPHLEAAAKTACDTHRPVPCSGTLPAVGGETLMWRSIFLPLRDNPEDSRAWLYAAFGCKRSAA